MAFKLVVSDTVSFAVKGRLPDQGGVPRPFEFTLNSRRMGAEEMKRLADDTERTVADVIAEKAEGWSGVLDGDDRPLSFTPEALQQLLDIPGMAGLVLAAYVEACGARGREKN